MKICFICMSLFMISAISSLSCDAADVTISINGNLLASSCDVVLSSTNQDIDIGQFSTADFPTVGSTTIFKPFDISLKDCSAGIVGTKVLFSGQQDKDNPQLLALQDVGDSGEMATGVGVEILDVNQKSIPINNSDSDLYSLKSGKNTLAFYLRYKSTKPTVTAGNATAIMYFDLQYQ